MKAATHSAASRTSPACAGSALMLGMRRSSASSSSSGPVATVTRPSLLAVELAQEELRRPEKRRRPSRHDLLELRLRRLQLPDVDQHQPEVEAHRGRLRKHADEGT